MWLGLILVIASLPSVGMACHNTLNPHCIPTHDQNIPELLWS
jgi:hypothetical protein